MQEIKLMKGNEAMAEAAIRAGADAYFGYPITPQSEVIEYLMLEDPFNRTGMQVLQAESELAAINMVYGAGSCGKKAMTSSSSPGISLKLEGISYMAGAEIPCLIANVMRGGPGLGTIQPGQADYFQAVKGGGHGDYRMIVLAPSTVQEMADFVDLGFELAFKYRNPVMILSDGAIGQMMEKVSLPKQKKRLTNEEIVEKYGDWATTGKPKTRNRNIITSLNLDPEKQEKHNFHLQKKYETIENSEIRYEEIQCEDADYIIVAFGSSARISQKAIQMGREKGYKIGLIRPITLWPFPKKVIAKYADKVKGFISIEMNAGQMIEDVQLAVNGKVPVVHYGRMGGMMASPSEVLNALEEKLISKN
ncbi:MAG: 3-methyl-2-oxobutanoate dehydrogenase subunit VorB [Flavobacteriaceae bacterium]|nr:3-methyl-2-oxobutanoate dehydrogenase subunit VorB [Flavobacteriaceae bacterium]